MRGTGRVSEVWRVHRPGGPGREPCARSGICQAGPARRSPGCSRRGGFRPLPAPAPGWGGAVPLVHGGYRPAPRLAWSLLLGVRGSASCRRLPDWRCRGHRERGSVKGHPALRTRIAPRPRGRPHPPRGLPLPASRPSGRLLSQGHAPEPSARYSASVGSSPSWARVAAPACRVHVSRLIVHAPALAWLAASVGPLRGRARCLYERTAARRCARRCRGLRDPAGRTPRLAGSSRADSARGAWSRAWRRSANQRVASVAMATACGTQHARPSPRSGCVPEPPAETYGRDL